MKPLNRILSLFLSGLLILGCTGQALAVDMPDDSGGNGYIVRLKDGAAPPPMALMSEAGHEDGAPSPIPYADGYYTAESLAQAQSWVEAGLVDYIEPNSQLELLDGPLTDDPLVASQWYLDMLGISGAWDAGLTGSGNVTVAVIDSGLYTSHEDLSYGNITGHNFLGNGTYPDYYDDHTGHGTFVTGIIAAQTDNTIGIAGLTENVKVLSLRCFTNSTAYIDARDSKSGTVSVVLSAIGYAMDNGADVINMSFGGTDYSVLQSLEFKLQDAASQGILLVASAGNNYQELGSIPYYPAAFDCVIGVGAVDSSGTVASYSQRNAGVYVTAPGSGIVGFGTDSASSYVSGNGTSFSAPMVSAMAAMVKQANSGIDNDGFKTLLKGCVTDAGEKGYDTSYGYGIVSASALSQELSESYTITYDCGGGSLSGTAGADYAAAYTIDRSSPVTLPTPSRTDYTFAGWYDNSSFSGNPLSIVPDGTVGDVTYYAKWYDSTETGISGITVLGYPAEETGDAAWSVILPAQYSLSSIDAEDISVTTEVGGVPVSTPLSADGGATWTYTVNSKAYTLSVIISGDHAPEVFAVSPIGYAIPASSDGLTSALPYSADISGWFRDGEGDSLSFEIVSVNSTATDGLAGAVPSLTGSTLSYTPAAGDAGKDIHITVRASDGTFDSLGAITATVYIFDLPASSSVISPTSADFDRFTQSEGYADLPVTLTLYGNTLVTIKNGESVLTPGTDYKLENDTDVSPDAATVTIYKEYLAAQGPGDLTLIFSFSEGETPVNDASLTVHITDSFIPVTGVTGVLSEATAGETVALTGTVAPSDATNRTIAWSVKDSGGTGAAIDGISFSAAAAGTAVVTASIANGLTESSSYTQDFNITVSEASGGGGGIGGGGGGGIYIPPVVTPPPLELHWENPFSDVTESSWYYDSVEFVCSNGLFNGMSQNTFCPDAGMTRAMLVTVLHRLAGKPSGSSASVFADIPEGSWYTDAVAWATGAGIASGTESGFQPAADITREQLISMLYRYAGSAGIAAESSARSIRDYADCLQVSSWAQDAMNWAVGTGVLTGSTGNSLNPKMGATRAEVAVILERFAELFDVQLPEIA